MHADSLTPTAAKLVNPCSVVVLLLGVLLASQDMVAQRKSLFELQVPASPSASALQKDEFSWLENAKNIAETWEAVLTGFALIVGGLWTYLLVVKKREIVPRATVAHEILQHPLSGRRRLLHVFIRVSNSSQVLLSLISGFCRVQQVLPVPTKFTEAVEKGKDPVPSNETEYPWPLLVERTFPWESSSRELEPGESDEILCDFVIDADAHVIEVYTYLKNKAKKGREIGWHLTTFYDMKEQKILSQAAPKPLPPQKSHKPNEEEDQ